MIQPVFQGKRFSKCFSHPEHLAKVWVSEAEGDIGHVQPLGLGLSRAFFITATPRSASR